MDGLTGEESVGWIPEGLECSGRGFKLPSQGAGETLKVFEQGDVHIQDSLGSVSIGLCL